MNLSEAFEEYRQNVIVFGGQSTRTEEQHQLTLKSLLAVHKDIELSKLTIDDIRIWKSGLEKTRSQSTVRSYVIKLRLVLGYHYPDNCTIDPELIPIPKRSNKPPVCITAEEVRDLIDSTQGKKGKAIISLLYASGIRVSELCALNRGDLKDGKFTVYGKGGKARLCFYDQRTELLISEYLKTRVDNHPALFRTAQGRISVNTVQFLFRYVRDKIGRDNIHPHTMRHTFATELMQSGMHIYTLSRLLGHSSIQTTEMYLHVSDPKLQEEYTKYHKI